MAAMTVGSAAAYQVEDKSFLTMYQSGGDERISSNGDFDFNVHVAVNGNLFSVKSNTASLSVNAESYDSRGEYCTDTAEYSVSILTDTLGLTKLKVNTITGVRGSGSTTTLNPDEKYYLRVSAATTVTTGSGPYYVAGSGHVSNVKAVY